MSRISPETVFVNGTKVPLHSGFVSAIFRNNKFHIFVAFSIALFALVRPYQQVGLERWQAITIITGVGIIVILSYLVAFLLWPRISRRTRYNRLYTVWVLTTMAFIASILGQKSLVFFGQEPKSLVDTLMVGSFHIVMFSALEMAFAVFVLPDVLASMQSLQENESADPLPKDVKHGSDVPLTTSPKPAAQELAALTPPPETPQISISDLRLDAASIRWVMSQEHYLSIETMKGQAYFKRGRMRDFLNQIPEEQGYCIHRSHWVTWEAIKNVIVDKDTMMVELYDEEKLLPVARGRRSDFIERWNRRSDPL